jgi:2,4-dienoyl-CoA reductase-like NADH-dependent reductase (Old Yellow Enzyme family)
MNEQSMDASEAETFRHLLSPIRLGSIDVGNRVVITAHGASDSFRHPALSPDAYIEYLRRRAAGGAGMIIVQPLLSGPLGAATAEITDRHARLAEAVRAEGATILLQITDLGVYGRSEGDVRRPPLVGFENTLSAAGEISHRMSHDEIEAVLEGYGRAARLAVNAGFDGVEVHGAHGYLVQQSLTPSFNSREDIWGQDRTLFARRFIAVVREQVGPERIVSYRTPTDDLISPEDGGLGFSGIAESVQSILSTGNIDVLNTTIGDGGPSYARAIPNYRYGEAPNMPAVMRLKEAIEIDIPIIGVGRILSPGVAEQLIAEGQCDMVAMTRAHIADPDLVSKTQAGRTHRIRPCVGANVCVNRKLQGYPEISCFHNPEVLREIELSPHRIANALKTVLVVGGGPAGLKAAETAAKRGHRVVVVDAADSPGGRLRSVEGTAASGLMSAVDYLVGELGELGVTIRRNTTADEGLIRELAPDHVILATGGRPIVDASFPDAGDGVLLTSEEALAGRVGHRILVHDTLGANEGPLVAEALAKRGARVTYSTTTETVMPWGGALHRAEVPDILRKRTDRIITNGVLGDVDGKKVLLVHPSDGETLAEFEVDNVVLVVDPTPRIELVAVVEGLGISYRVVGDALAPRTSAQAFKEGAEAALAL